MLRSRFAAFALATLLPTLPALASCTLIVPDASDEVAQCGNPTDCPTPDDGRLSALCDNNSEPGVCYTDWKEIACDPSALPADHIYPTTFNEVRSSRYSCGEFQGQQGCPPEPGMGCNSGLTENDDGICDVDGGDAISIGTNDDELLGQDVSDQFCRSLFCDESFVCKRLDTRNPTCTPCDPNEPFGAGGCGTVYVGGQPSTVYQDVSGGGCAEGSLNDVVIGPLE